MRAADARAWLERIAERQPDYLMLGRPRTLERDWALELPAIFEMVERAGDNVLFRIDHDALDHALRNTPGAAH